MSTIFNKEALLTVGELSRRSGVAISAIHFYETKNLLKSTRSSSNHRLFSRRELRVLALIKVAQKLGFSLEEIQIAFKDLPMNRTPNRQDWEKISSAWQIALQEKIQLAIRMNDQLNTCIGCGCLSLTDCPLRNPEDSCGAQGTGPQLLLEED